MQQERRRAPRYPFIATAEVTELPDKPPMNTRVIELSLFGCYIEMPQPLAEGVEIHVKIYSEGKFFEGNGRIIYADANRGVGVSFKDVRPQYLTVLKQWLVLAAHTKFSKPG